MQNNENPPEPAVEDSTLSKRDKRTSTASRKDLQLPRRLFHMGMGCFAATFYGFLLTHKQAVYILGTTACCLYVLEQIRISYPEIAKHIKGLNQYLLRAEEQLHESSAIPYAISILLTILSFPKPIALSAILTLAISDPLSALFGIRFGTHKVVSGKSVEGSLAYFVSCFIVIYVVFHYFVPSETYILIWLALICSFAGTLFEMIPLKLDDNLTIPLFTAFSLWILCGLMGIAPL